MQMNKTKKSPASYTRLVVQEDVILLSKDGVKVLVEAGDVVRVYDNRVSEESKEKTKDDSEDVFDFSDLADEDEGKDDGEGESDHAEPDADNDGGPSDHDADNADNADEGEEGEEGEEDEAGEADEADEDEDGTKKDEIDLDDLSDDSLMKKEAVWRLYLEAKAAKKKALCDDKAKCAPAKKAVAAKKTATPKGGKK
jgi:cobalamin biosynthesis protein CobT